MGGLIGARYAQRYGDELAGLVAVGAVDRPDAVLRGLVQLPAGTELPDDPIDPAVLSRDLSVGEAYANDPLVWHGGWKRTTLEAFHRANQADRRGPRLRPTAGALHPRGGRPAGADARWPSRPCERLTGDDFMEQIVAEARHEVFNELDKVATIALVAGFVERVTAN